jgi:hypothetical protein
VLLSLIYRGDYKPRKQVGAHHRSVRLISPSIIHLCTSPDKFCNSRLPRFCAARSHASGSVSDPAWFQNTSFLFKDIQSSPYCNPLFRQSKVKKIRYYCVTIPSNVHCSSIFFITSHLTGIDRFDEVSWSFFRYAILYTFIIALVTITTGFIGLDDEVPRGFQSWQARHFHPGNQFQTVVNGIVTIASRPLLTHCIISLPSRKDYMV